MKYIYNLILIILPLIGKSDIINDPAFFIIEFKKNRLTENSKATIKEILESRIELIDSTVNVVNIGFTIYNEGYINKSKDYIKRTSSIIKYVREDLLFSGIITISIRNDTKIILLNTGEEKIVQSYFYTYVKEK